MRLTKILLVVEVKVVRQSKEMLNIMTRELFLELSVDKLANEAAKIFLVVEVKVVRQSKKMLNIMTRELLLKLSVGKLAKL